MTKYIVEGGRPLFGEIPISGAKNAAVAIIPAALMVSGPCRIENMPQISDVTLLLGILRTRPPLAWAVTKPLWVDTWAPRARKPFRCWSMGRVLPKSHPPGRDTSARPNRPSSAPSI